MAPDFEGDVPRLARVVGNERTDVLDAHGDVIPVGRVGHPPGALSDVTNEPGSGLSAVSDTPADISGAADTCADDVLDSLGY